MIVLVTGGGGFLGRHIVRQLQQRGATVRVLGRRDYPELTAAGAECFRASLGDQAAVAAACAGVEAVFHVAAKTGIWGRRRDYLAANVTGTENVLAACRRQGVRRLVYTSTPSVVYGNRPINGGDESLPYAEKYLTPYAATKAAAERLVLDADGAAGLHTCSLRPHLIWGPGDTNLAPRLVRRSREGRLVRVGAGVNRISVSYVENIAAAHLQALDRLEAGSRVCGQCYFVNEEEPVNCWDFIGRLLAGLECPPVRKAMSLKAARRLGLAFEIIYRLLGIGREPPMTRFLALQLGTDHWFRIDKAKRDLEWEPAVGLEEGLERLAAVHQEKPAAVGG